MWNSSFGSACEVVLSLHWVTVRTAGTEERPPTIPSHVSNSERNLIISSHLFLTSWLLDSSIFYCSSNTHFKDEGTWFLNIWIKLPLNQHVLLHTSKKKLTGLLIQSMSALSDKDSSGPKSVTGWASTLELCFLLSMLKLALVSKYKTEVWGNKEKAVLVTWTTFTLITQNECPTYAYSYVNYTHVPLYCV